MRGCGDQYEANGGPGQWQKLRDGYVHCKLERHKDVVQNTYKPEASNDSCRIPELASLARCKI